MAVCDCDFFGTVILPSDADPLLFVDTDAELPPAVTSETFEPVSPEGRQGGLLTTPVTPVDLMTEEVQFAVTNEFGTIWRGRLFPGDLVANKKGTSFKFKDKGAKRMRGRRSGISKVKLKYKLVGGYVTWPFFLEVWGDFSRVTVPLMTQQVLLGDDMGYITAEWQGRYGKKWKLTDSIFNNLDK